MESTSSSSSSPSSSIASQWSIDELRALSKEELIQYILSQQQKQRDDVGVSADDLSKGLKRARVESNNNNNTKKQSKRSKKDAFSMDNYALRHIALRIAYVGGAYQGFASQRHTTETIESKLFSALIQARLIDVMGVDVSQPITSTSELARRAVYSRCGRTDKGVSAFGQVVALHLRSNLTQEDVGVVSLPSSEKLRGGKPKTTEIDYASILNGLLPDDIRIVGWAPVPLNFNARFGSLGTRMWLDVHQRIFKR